jgi:hypothetical protein
MWLRVEYPWFSGLGDAIKKPKLTTLVPAEIRKGYFPNTSQACHRLNQLATARKLVSYVTCYPVTILWKFYTVYSVHSDAVSNSPNTNIRTIL